MEVHASWRRRGPAEAEEFTIRVFRNGVGKCLIHRQYIGGQYAQRQWSSFGGRNYWGLFDGRLHLSLRNVGVDEDFFRIFGNRAEFEVEDFTHFTGPAARNDSAEIDIVHNLGDDRKYLCSTLLIRCRDGEEFLQGRPFPGTTVGQGYDSLLTADQKQVWQVIVIEIGPLQI